MHCVALGFIVSGLLLSEGSEVQILPETLKRSISDNMILSDIDLFMIDIYLLKIKEILNGKFLLLSTHDKTIATMLECIQIPLDSI